MGLALSSTVTVDDSGGSITTVTKIVLPAATVVVLWILPTLEEVLLAVPSVVGEMGATMTTLRAPEAVETFPAVSVAVAVTLWTPGVKELVGIV